MAEIDKRISDGHIRRVKGNSYIEDLKSGNAIAGIVWTGDLFILRAETENDNWQFVIPESGGTLWSDNMMVPITSHAPQERRGRSWTTTTTPRSRPRSRPRSTTSCPVQGAQAEMEKIDPELAESPFIFPSESYIKDHNIKGFRALNPRRTQRLQRRVGKGGGQLMSIVRQQ